MFYQHVFVILLRGILMSPLTECMIPSLPPYPLPQHLHPAQTDWNPFFTPSVISESLMGPPLMPQPSDSTGKRGADRSHGRKGRQSQCASPLWGEHESLGRARGERESLARGAKVSFQPSVLTPAARGNMADITGCRFYGQTLVRHVLQVIRTLRFSAPITISS